MVGREMNRHRLLLIIGTVTLFFYSNSRHKVNENCCERKKENDKRSEACITRLGKKSIKNQGFEPDMVTDSRKMIIEPIQ